MSDGAHLGVDADRALGAPHATALDDPSLEALADEILAEVVRIKANGCPCDMRITIERGPTVDGCPSTFVDYGHNRADCPYINKGE